MINLENLVRENIKKLKPYSSARDEYSGEEGIFLDANENPLGSVSGDALNRYPDPLQRKVKERLAQLREITPEHIFLGNGSDEAIDLLIRAFCEPGRDKIMILPPTYGMYEVCAEINNVAVKSVNLTPAFDIDLAKILAMITKDRQIKLIFLCSPNNPSGNCLNREAINKILESFTGLVIIDEAYIDFCNQQSWLHTIGKFNNLIVLQTFSKLWGLANIRLGAAFADDEIIGILNKIKYPYNINGITQSMALKALENIKQRDNMVRTILQQRDFLRQELKSLDIVKVIFPSDANFLLVRFEKAKDIYNYLLRNKIILRDRTTAPLCSDCLRITVGTAQENEQLIKALKQYEDKKNEEKSPIY
jgi:histidinol-phosphate aminotransferase